MRVCDVRLFIFVSEFIACIDGVLPCLLSPMQWTPLASSFFEQSSKLGSLMPRQFYKLPVWEGAFLDSMAAYIIVTLHSAGRSGKGVNPPRSYLLKFTKSLHGISSSHALPFFALSDFQSDVYTGTYLCPKGGQLQAVSSHSLTYCLRNRLS